MKATDGRQLRAARAVLGLKIDEAAALAGLNRNSVTRVEGMERFRRWTGNYAAEKLASAYEKAGCSFMTNGGVACVMFVSQRETRRNKAVGAPETDRRGAQ